MIRPRMRAMPIIRKRMHAGLSSRRAKSHATARSCVTPVAKPVKGQSYQNPHYTANLLSSRSSSDLVIEDVLSFIGPPSTGKTSRNQSIARAPGWLFQRIALDGVRDEAEIRGHRRTYVASGPGLFAQAPRKTGRMDPVPLL